MNRQQINELVQKMNVDTATGAVSADTTFAFTTHDGLVVKATTPSTEVKRHRAST